MSSGSTTACWLTGTDEVCGICGWVGRPTEGGQADVVTAMATAMSHRGPDGAGYFSTNPGEAIEACLGHRRLKILDLSDAAHQPMPSEDGRVQLLLNGEIYNFRELRRRLEGLGHRFRSTGDTEVALRAYLEWGEGSFTRLDGMFAIAVWDQRSAALVLARDRVGKKPLFFTHADGRVTFASEIKSLARAPWMTLRAAHDQMAEFLANGFCPSPRTMYVGIEQVMPGTFVRYSPAGDVVAQETFWDPLARRTRPLEVGPQVIDSIAAAVDDAVRKRLISDVPIGALLSGGVDSSVVVALMQRHAPEPVRTFSIGFPEASSFDERPHARLVAASLGTEHSEFEVRADASQLLDRLVWMHDGPFGDSSAIPTYLVFEAAAPEVRVLLTGDGGDETFAGYQRFAAAALSRLVPPPLMRLIDAGAGLLPQGGHYFDLRRRLRRFALDADSLEQRYFRWMTIVNESERRRLLRERSTHAGSAFMRAYEEAAFLPPVDRLIHANLRTYLPDDLAVKLDRASMAHSLEARSPLLDTGVIELLLHVRARDKVGFARPKPVLRAAFESLLPSSVWRRPKHGFGVPIDDWFMGELGVRFHDEVLAADGRLPDVLERAELHRLWTAHRERREKNGAKLWSLLTLEHWLRDLGRPQALHRPTSSAPDAVVS
jgi:asparagine synthase (glutamine-hydrolysing)